MRKSFICIATIFLLASSGIAIADQKDDEAQRYLEPETGVLAESYLMYDYEREIRELFNKGLDGYLIRMYYLPSFNGFNFKFVGIKKTNAKYSILLLMAPKNTRGKGIHRYTQDPVEEYSADIDLDTVERLRALWGNMLLRTRYPQRARIGHDGETYHFSTFVDWRGDISGKIWSPDKDTNTGRLVEIGNLLADYVMADTENRKEILKNVRAKAEDLQNRLKE